MTRSIGHWVGIVAATVGAALAVGVVVSACDGSLSVPTPASTETVPGSALSSVPTTAGTPSSVAPTTTRPPVPIVVSEGFWPAGIEALLIADGDRVVRLQADGALDELLVGDYVAAFDDRRDGVAFVTLDRKDGQSLPTMYWQTPTADPGFVIRSDEMHPLGVLDIPTLWPGPGFAMYLYDTRNVPGDTCVGYVPLRSLDGSFISMEGWLLCRRLPEILVSAAWSGRYFALVVAEGDQTRLEFEGPGGQLLPVTRGEPMLFTNSPEPAAGETIDQVSVAPGTNLIAYTVTAGSSMSAPTYLVVHDLDSGNELLRTAVANTGTQVTNLDMTATGVVVSRQSDRPVSALMIDIASHQIGEVPMPGFATIAGRQAAAPVLYPPRVGNPVDIVVTDPLDHARLNSQVFRFEGLTQPGSRVASGAYEAEVDQGGQWSLSLTLRPGSNVAGFGAVGPDDSSAEASVAVLYQPEPSGPVGQVYGLVASRDEPGPPQIQDVWTSPAQQRQLWAVATYQLDESASLNVRVLADVAPSGAEVTSSDALWLSDIAYTDRGVTAWTVLDAVAIEPAGSVDRCWSPDGEETAGPTFVLFDRVDRSQLLAWRVDVAGARFLEIDPLSVDCHPMVAG